MIVTLEMAYSNLFPKGMRRAVARDFILYRRTVILWSCPMDRHVSMRELREILVRLLVGLAVFLIAVLIYKQNDPYAYPGLEDKILYALAPVGIITLCIYLIDSDVCSRLLRAGGVTGVMRDNRYTRLCNELWQGAPPPVRMVASFCIRYGFIVSLLLVMIQSIAPGTVLLVGLRTHLMVATALLGAVTFYLNRDKLADIEVEARQEEIAEKKRDAEFSERYPRVNRVWGLRRVVRRGYKEGWWYSTAVIILLIIGFSIRLYRLGELSLWWDELITGMVVTRIGETGLPLRPSGLEYYWRGVAYHYFVVIFTYVFGLTEFAIRFPSVLFGMGIAFLSFLVGKKIDKWVGLLVLLFMTFSTYNIEYSRFARFYVMNVFLFMLSLFFVYEGFFKDRMKYKIASLVIFLIMMHTVQLGRFFMFIIGGYFGYELIRFIISKGNMEIIKQNGLNFVFLGFSLIILQLGNVFQRFFSIHIVRAYEISDTVVAPAPYPIIQFPDWDFFKFMDNAHIPVIFTIIFLLFSIYTLLKNIKGDTNRFLTYVSIVFVISVISFEVLNRDRTGARICLIFEGLYVFFSIYTICAISRIYSKQKKILQVVSLSFVVLLLVSITPNIYERININYGDDITDDPFRTTHVAAYRADYKTQYVYLNEHIEEEDVWINVMDAPYFYIHKIPTYIINQNSRWNTYALLDGTDGYRGVDGHILINTADDIRNIIETNPHKRVWVVVNGGSVRIIHTTHTHADFLNFLEGNKNKTVYRSPDGYSMVLLLTPITPTGKIATKWQELSQNLLHLDPI